LLSPSEVSASSPDAPPSPAANRKLSFLPSPRSPGRAQDIQLDEDEGARNGLLSSRRKSKVARAPVARGACIVQSEHGRLGPGHTGKLECRKLLGHLLESARRLADKVTWYTADPQATAVHDEDEEDAPTITKSKDILTVDELYELVVQVRLPMQLRLGSDKAVRTAS
jgi:hypothetical protein